jgi:hypothetical protein
MNGFDGFSQGFIFSSVLAGGSSFPSKVATDTHFQNSAHELKGELLAMLRDKLIDQ